MFACLIARLFVRSFVLYLFLFLFARLDMPIVFCHIIFFCFCIFVLFSERLIFTFKYCRVISMSSFHSYKCQFVRYASVDSLEEQAVPKKSTLENKDHVIILRQLFG